LVYWFRYCCTFLLRNSQEQLAAIPVPADSRFGVASVVERLRTEEELDPLRLALDRDYRVFTYLAHHAAGLELASLEDRLLLVDYKLMQLWYRLTSTAAPRQAREALVQMASILNVLVSKMSQQAGVNAQV
jgi:hypothetical protein